VGTTHAAQQVYDSAAYALQNATAQAVAAFGSPNRARASDASQAEGRVVMGAEPSSRSSQLRLAAKRCARRSRSHDRVRVPEHDVPFSILTSVDGGHPEGEGLELGTTAEHRATAFDLVVAGEIIRYEFGEYVERR
jgi:hypothetical protein